MPVHASSPVSSALDRTFLALADPTRRAIVERLIEGPRSVSELALPLGLSLAAIAHHLHVLEGGGLVRSAKSGRVRTCRVRPTALRDVERWVETRRADWERRLDGLERYLRRDERQQRRKGNG